MWILPLRWQTRTTRGKHASELPLCAELFSDEQLRRHAIALAGQHQLDPEPGPNRLLLRLGENERVPIQAYELVTSAEAGGQRVTPAGEWLLDSFYLIEQQIRMTRVHLPRTYSRELPRLLDGASAGFPRAYDVALELIAHADGRLRLESILHVRWSLRRSVTRLLRRFPIYFYLGPLLVLTVATSSLLLEPLGGFAWQDWRGWLLLLLGTLGASQMGVALVNLLMNRLVGPRLLPRLDFSTGIPAADRTMVVIPTLLTRPRAVSDLLEGLEIRYLGNRDPNLWFALLTDFRDAPELTQPDDEGLLRQVREGIQALNARYCPEGVAVFHLLHRPRVWNPHERLWMGYERKRGKLEQFNALLRGGPRAPFAEIIGAVALFPTIRYVLTLDTDTGLPRDAARKLIGTLTHPLNRPRFDPASGRVVEGYAILQPRTPITLLSANRSRFAQLSAGEAGIDPYTHEVSDVYQDLFAEGSYVGKGIYDVDAFRQATAGRFPENLILSHDLVESG